MKGAEGNTHSEFPHYHPCSEPCQLGDENVNDFFVSLGEKSSLQLQEVDD